VAAASDAPRAADVKCSDLLMLAYTSGTTGPSKGSMLSHAAALTYGTSAAEAQGYRESDVFYVCLPLFHNNALLAATGAALVCGASVVLSRRFSVSRFWGEIRDSNATVTNFLGAMSSFLWSSPPVAAATPTTTCAWSAWRPRPSTPRAFEQRFGLRAMNNYGLSDLRHGHLLHRAVRAAREARLHRQVHAAAFDVKIVDEHDFEVPDGEVGEIVLQSARPVAPPPSATTRCPTPRSRRNRNQWFHTGDRGVQRRGRLPVLRRPQEGLHPPPRREHLGLRGRADHRHASGRRRRRRVPGRHADQRRRGGRGGGAAPGSTVSEVELVAHCQRNMAYFMVPRYIQFRDALPTTVNQKVEKFRLRSEFERDLSQAWDREAACRLVLAR
jgi:crotonobetaine/carnitine-CoA ligase